MCLPMLVDHPELSLDLLMLRLYGSYLGKAMPKFEGGYGGLFDEVLGIERL
jgi:hypothetical protein